MRGLKVLVVAMGVLIVVGTGGLVAAVVYRATHRDGAVPIAVAPMVAGAGGGVVLDEPAGTRIVGATGGGDALVLRLEGGGPDRVVVVDGRTGVVTRRVGLAR